MLHMGWEVRTSGASEDLFVFYFDKATAHNSSYDRNKYYCVIRKQRKHIARDICTCYSMLIIYSTITTSIYAPGKIDCRSITQPTSNKSLSPCHIVSPHMHPIHDIIGNPQVIGLLLSNRAELLSFEAHPPSLKPCAFGEHVTRPAVVVVAVANEWMLSLPMLSHPIQIYCHLWPARARFSRIFPREMR